MTERYIDTGREERGKRIGYAVDVAISLSGLPVVEVARRMGVSPNTVSKWTRGESFMNVLQIVPFADMVGVAPEFFVSPPPVPEYPIDRFRTTRQGNSAAGPGYVL